MVGPGYRKARRSEKQGRRGPASATTSVQQRAARSQPHDDGTLSSPLVMSGVLRNRQRVARLGR